MHHANITGLCHLPNTPTWCTNNSQTRIKHPFIDQNNNMRLRMPINELLVRIWGPKSCNSPILALAISFFFAPISNSHWQHQSSQCNFSILYFFPSFISKKQRKKRKEKSDVLMLLHGLVKGNFFFPKVHWCFPLITSIVGWVEDDQKILVVGTSFLFFSFFFLYSGKWDLWKGVDRYVYDVFAENLNASWNL